MIYRFFPLTVAIFLIWGCNMSATGHRNKPPQAPREFRAAWVATVANIDWPSKPGLSTSQQQEEAIAILDRARDLNLNAIVLQVRPSADALYASEYEPWSYYLTGHQGRPPVPYYDPLQFWIDEAHKRGLELHAWFNPYRARHGGAKYETAPNHVSKTNPSIVREFNGWQWLDPAEPAAQDLTYNVFVDVVRRYDVDGIHIDDYFYPYPDYLKNADFPDEAAWARYLDTRGQMSREDWRRHQVDRLIERIYEGTKKTKKEVKFGISPFGIARPGRPPVVKSSFDQYAKLYADAEKWLHEGWLDYWTPQLYWKIDSPQPYEALLRFWMQQNLKQRHLWPGNFTSRVSERARLFVPSATQAALPPAELEKERQKFEEEQHRNRWTVDELLEQIRITRQLLGNDSGNVHFSMKALMSSETTLAQALKSGPYAQPALVPASTWLDNTPPAPPKVPIAKKRVSWSPGSKEQPWLWAVWTKHADAWKFSVYPGSSEGFELSSTGEDRPSAVCVSAVDRCGNESKRVTLKIPG